MKDYKYSGDSRLILSLLYAMPQMDGLQLAAAIKKEWPELPILVASGFAEMSPETDHSLCLLWKPFSKAELAMEIARVLENKKTGRSKKAPGSVIAPFVEITKRCSGS